MKFSKLRFVISTNGIRHAIRGKVYLCNGAVEHTKDYDTCNIHPPCSQCLMIMGGTEWDKE